MRAGCRMERFGDYNRGDGVFENQLLLVIGLEHNGIFVEALDAAGKLYATHQIDGQEGLVLPCII